MPDRNYLNVCGWAAKLLAFIRRTICPEANSNVKREMRILSKLCAILEHELGLAQAPSRER
jgi:hypothetical protein